MTSNSIEYRSIHVDAKTQLENAKTVRHFFEDLHSNMDLAPDLFSPNIRAFFDSNPGDPVEFKDNKYFMGTGELKAGCDAYTGKGFYYDVVINEIFTSGPLVIVNRTDIRKQDGQPDIHIPAVGVFAFKNGKLIEWSDYFR